MSYIQKAIEKAESAGWIHQSSKSWSHAYALLDPLFWEAINRDLRGGTLSKKASIELWHQFVDHLAEGKDAESFFSKLVNN